MTAPASTNGHATDPRSAAEAATLRRLMMGRGEAAERRDILVGGIAARHPRREFRVIWPPRSRMASSTGP